MSKTNKIKRKTTAFDIVYRVVTAIMAVLIYPLFYFLDLIYIQINHDSISELWNLLTQSGETGGVQATYETISLSNLGAWVDTFSGFFDKSTDSVFDILSGEIYRPLLVAVGFLAVALLLGLVIFGFAVFSNKVKVIAGLSLTGFVCTIVSFLFFAEGFAAPIINGEITLSQLIGENSGLVFNLILGVIGDVSALNLQGAFFAVMFLMLGIAVWSISVMVVNAGEEKEKEAKRLARENRK